MECCILIDGLNKGTGMTGENDNPPHIAVPWLQEANYLLQHLWLLLMPFKLIVSHYRWQ